MLRILLAAVGLAAMIAAGSSLLLSLPPGFPDGTITPYDQATMLWSTVLTYALLLAGIFTLVAAVMRKPRRAVAGAIVAVLLYVSVTLIEQCPRLDWCTSAVMQLTGTMLDDGTGG